MGLRLAVVVLSILWLVAPAVAEEPARLLINLHGDRVEYSQDLNTVAVTGHVTITAQSDKPGAPTVSIAANQVEADLTSGIIIAHDTVKVLSQQAALKGDTVRLNVRTDEFVLERGAASADMPNAQFPGAVVRGFFTGSKLCREGQVLIVIEGRITTCDRVRPHYSIGARKISYDMKEHELRLEHGSISLYGHKLTLPAKLTLPYGGSDDKGFILPLPQWSKYDGLYVNLGNRFAWDGIPWTVDAYVHVGTTLRFPAGLEITNEGDHGVFTATLSRGEQEVWDFRERSRVDRAPELRYLRHLQPTGKGLSRLDAEVFAGHLYEHVEDEGTVEASRAGMALHYSPMPARRRARDGWWTAADLYGTVYDTGDHLTDLRLEAGTGTHLSRQVGVAVWGVHHVSEGASPFRFDDVYATNEGFASLDLHPADNHRLQLYGHYDFDRDSFRDYSARYSYRAHCLTWSLEYNFAREAFTLGVDLNGLTGDTPPLQTAPIVLPDEVPPLPTPVPAAPKGGAPTPPAEPPPPAPTPTPTPAAP